MGGRPSMPMALILSEKKGHYTKAEIETRSNAEKTLYTGVKFREQQQVKDCPAAHAEFLRLKRLYSKIPYVDALDEQIINRYCLEIATIYDLQSRKERLMKDLEMAEKVEERIPLYDMIDKTLASMDRCKARLFKYEDRLYLNPAGRMRAIPKKPEKKEDQGGVAAFLKKRADTG